VTGVRLAGLAGRRPSRLVTNEDLAAGGLDTDDEWIRSRSGIRTRGLAGPGESVSRLSCDAAAKALASSGIEGSTVGLTIVATTTHPTSIPGTSASVAASYGSRGGAVDLGAACAGFSYALGLAADSIRAGSVQTAVVVGVDRMGDVVDWTDRGTCVLFADGAGAVVLTADAERNDVSLPVWGSDGDQGHVIGQHKDTGFIHMDGPAVYRWATTAMAPIARAACERAGIEPGELAAFVPHQANLRIIDSLVRALGLDESSTVVARDVVTAGNTSAASIPLALSALHEAGQITPGGHVLLVGFGAGLSWSAQVVRLP
jgi:3-oxoacyl-[acyl-carrier-protein] synthase-3